MSAVPAGLGRRADLEDEIRALGEPGLTPARVLAQHTNQWLVAPPGGEPRLVPARGRLRDAASGPPVSGDWIVLDEAGAICHVLERRGVIVRADAGTTTEQHVLAANVDLAFIAEPLPEPNERRIERLAAVTSAGGVEAVVVLTKADLVPDAGGDAAAWRLGQRVGLEAIAVSGREAREAQTAGDPDVTSGLGEVRARLAPGTTAVLLGPSGAGKSTLANALLGEDRQATRPVRAVDGRGRHTTVTRDLLVLPDGAFLLDTPGVRLVRLWDGAGSAFADIEELARGCRFADCRHEDEPGCAVRGAVDPKRLKSWRKLAREQAWTDDRRAAEAERDARHKAITKYLRAEKRARW